MPELPEMETYKILLGQKLSGQTITAIEVNREKSINITPGQFSNELINKRITSMDRRGKHLIFNLDTGKSLLLHLMLGGWMYLGSEDDQPERTKQVILSFGNRKLYFIGLRLGWLHLLSRNELEERLSELGPEPLSEGFNEAVFMERFKAKKGTLKTALANQEFIAGIGNCYSDEICYSAGILPYRKIQDLTDAELKALYMAIKNILPEAIQAGGYMENPLFKGDNLTGGYNNQCLVYDESGKPCRRCGNLIVKDEISSRKAFYCPNCQN